MAKIEMRKDNGNKVITMTYEDGRKIVVRGNCNSGWKAVLCEKTPDGKESELSFEGDTGEVISFLRLLTDQRSRIGE